MKLESMQLCKFALVRIIRINQFISLNALVAFDAFTIFTDKPDFFRRTRKSRSEKAPFLKKPRARPTLASIQDGCQVNGTPLIVM